MRLRILLVLCATLALAVGAATASAGGGNSANAKLCQKNGWKSLTRSDGTTFNNQGECVSYGAKGGTISQVAPITTYLAIASACPQLAGYSVRGTGFTPNHAITFTATGLGPTGSVGAIGTVTTDSTGAFDSGTDFQHFWEVAVGVADNPQTVHITATDGVHLGSTDLVNPTC